MGLSSKVNDFTCRFQVKFAIQAELHKNDVFFTVLT